VVSARFKIIILIIAIIVLSILFYLSNNNNSKTVTHTHDKKIIIVYYEGGSYYDYVSTLIAFIDGLVSINIIEPIKINGFRGTDNSRKLWDYLCDNVKSNHIRLDKENYYSSNWNDNIRKLNKEKIIKFLLDSDPKFTTVIAMGTWAGLDLANNDHQVPTMVMSVTDPVNAGILKSKNDYSIPHVFVEYEPNIFLRQIILFHSIFDFKKLGIAFDDTDDGRTYIAYSDILKAAKQKGFDVITCTFNDANPNLEELKKAGKECVYILSQKADAIYFGDQSFLKYEWMPEVIQSTIDNKIPTWSHHGAEHVKRGVLMSRSFDSSFEKKGVWLAEVFNDITHGKQANTINHIWVSQTELAINLEVADKIGFVISDALLSLCDKIFKEIKDSSEVQGNDNDIMF
jgi:ABC-type uncharacterized transport system substrate-binding protein